MFSSEGFFLPIVGLLAVMCSWRLAALTNRRVRRLVAWVETHHGERWRALPLFYRLVPVGGVKYLYRRCSPWCDLPADPEFMILYRDYRRARVRHNWYYLLIMMPVIVILLGVFNFDWRW
jgi:hypothetical protein